MPALHPRRLTAALLAALATGHAHAASFVYQGALTDGGHPADGAFDLQLQLYGSRGGADPIGAPITVPAIAVRNGVFKVDAELDAKGLGGDAYVAVAVRASGSGETFAPVAGRAKVALAPEAIGACWSTTGDAGSDPATNFLGTTDLQPFELRTNNVRALRVEPIATNGANVILGAPNNAVAAGVQYATIGGGGFQNAVPGPNLVNSNGSVVAGGANNVAGVAAGGPAGSQLATVGGGFNNQAKGSFSTIAGGHNNVATYQTFIGGGDSNVASNINVVIAGGATNTAAGGAAAIGGGYSNAADSAAATIAGGGVNRVTASGDYGAIGGGESNIAAGSHSTVAGGNNNIAGASGSFAAGTFATVRSANNAPDVPSAAWGVDADGDEGSFVWADASSTNRFATSGPNQFLVRASGGVGINTNSPTSLLDVMANKSGFASLVVNQSTVAGTGGIGIKLGPVTPNTNFNFLTFQNGNSQSIGAIEGNGSGGVQLNTTGGDYGEWLPLADRGHDAKPGDVVGIRDGRIVRQTDDADAVGVVSTGAAVAGNSPGEGREDDHRVIAFVGQVEVTVDGPVRAGDLIVPSGRGDGRARAVSPERLDARDARRVLGRAWSTHAGTGAHRVRTFVSLGGLAEPALARAENAARELDAQRREIALLRDELATLRREQERLAGALARQAAAAVASSR